MSAVHYPLPEPPAPVDLSPLIQQIAALKHTVDHLPEPPAPVDLEPVYTYINTLPPPEATPDRLRLILAISFIAATWLTYLTFWK